MQDSQNKGDPGLIAGSPASLNLYFSFDESWSRAWKLLLPVCIDRSISSYNLDIREQILLTKVPKLPCWVAAAAAAAGAAINHLHGETKLSER